MKKTPQTRPKGPQAQRLAREAEALRANMAKRKEQMRQRQSEKEAAPARTPSRKED